MIPEWKAEQTAHPDAKADRWALVERLTGYTPGPWWIEIEAEPEFDAPTIYVVHPATVCDATTVCNLHPANSAGKSERTANAQLIAAAPDLHAALTAALDEIERLEMRISSLDHALNFILADAAWTPKHPACESIINRINALRKGADQ